MAGQPSLFYSLKKELSELLFFFFPIVVITFFNYLFLFAEKVFLGRISTQFMEAAVAVGYLVAIFQGSLVGIAMMAQVDIGKKHAAQDWRLIGPVVWQWIWFALLSMLLTVPANLLYGYLYFHGTEIEAVAWPYFCLIISATFLYPLGAVLSCFFLGQRKRKLVFFGTLSCHVLKLGLAYLLIFGWSHWIPALGLLGGAVSALIAQGGLCLLLLGVFLNSTNTALYDTRNWPIRLKILYSSIKPGLFRGITRILGFTCWAAITHLMIEKGGNHLLVLSVGGTIFLLCQCAGDALCQAQMTLVSRLLGARDHFRLQQALAVGLLMAAFVSFLLAIPLLLYPQLIFGLLFPTISIDPVAVSNVLWGVWLSVSFFTISYIPTAHVLAFQDMKFFVAMGGLNWVNGFLWMYWMIDFIEIKADQFWIALCFTHIFNGAGSLWRAKVLSNRACSAGTESREALGV